MSKNTLVVNFFSGPGAGKSSMATSVFSSLKWKNWNCEYVPEFAKSLVWEKSIDTLKDQFYISAKQYHSIFKLIGQVDIILTDSPILLGIIYAPDEPQCFKDTLLHKFNEMNNLNIFLNRKKVYEPIGRLQTEEEALEKDTEIKNLLYKNGIMVYPYDANKESIENIVSTVETYYQIINK